jgi:hypothetical protein
MVTKQLPAITSSNSNVVIAVQLDTWSSAARYAMDGSDVVKVSIPEPNMGSADTLAEFLRWGKSAIPDADHYIVMIVDHGAGWKGISYDEHPKDYLTMKEVDAGLAGFGGKIDILHFDACSMGQVEVAYEVRDRADFVVFSQSTDRVDYYRNRFKSVGADTTPSEMVSHVLADRYATGHYDSSAVNTKALDALAAASGGLALAINDTTKRSDVRSVFRNATRTAYDWVDIGSLTTRLLAVPDANVQQRASEVKAALADAVFGVKSRHSNRSGISIENPFNGITATYSGLEWSIDTNWGGLV